MDSIIGLAEKMDIDSVAEGIESQEISYLSERPWSELSPGILFRKTGKQFLFCNQYYGG